MGRIYQLALIILLITTKGYTQDIIIGFQTGIGTYSMDGLKKINTGLAQHIEFDIKPVSDFPAYWYYRPSFSITVHKVNLGLIYSYQSTGSRLSGKDYSGEYRFDMVVNSHCPGLYVDYPLFSKGKFDLTIYATGGLIFSNLKINEYFNLFDTVRTNETTTFKALNYYLEPGLELKYSLFNQIYIGFNAGYFSTLGKEEYYTDNDKQKKLFDRYNSTTIKPEWNGFRFGLSVSYYFINKTLIKPQSK